MHFSVPTMEEDGLYYPHKEMTSDFARADAAVQPGVQVWVETAKAGAASKP